MLKQWSYGLKILLIASNTTNYCFERAKHSDFIYQGGITCYQAFQNYYTIHCQAPSWKYSSIFGHIRYRMLVFLCGAMPHEALPLVSGRPALTWTSDWRKSNTCEFCFGWQFYDTSAFLLPLPALASLQHRRMGLVRIVPAVG